MEMSITATSGRTFRACSMASRPSEASTTTFISHGVVHDGPQPGPDDAVVVGQQNPDHATSPYGVAQGYPEQNHGPLSRAGDDAQLSPGQEGPLPHSGQAQAVPVRFRLRVEPLAVVLHPDLQGAAFQLQLDLHVPGLGVPGHVGQGLLDHPEDGNGSGLVQGAAGPRGKRRRPARSASRTRKCTTPGRPPGPGRPGPGAAAGWRYGARR